MQQIKDIPHLFPKPSKLKSKKMKTWYTKNQKVGKNTIDTLMSDLSGTFKLSRRYTNHCIRVTMVTVLKEKGFSNSDICKYTGHKDPKSVDRYSRKRRDEDFHDMSTALHEGTSKIQVDVQKISKKSRVTIKRCEETSRGLPGTSTTPAVINIQFSGSFQNCQFVLPKEN